MKRCIGIKILRLHSDCIPKALEELLIAIFYFEYSLLILSILSETTNKTGGISWKVEYLVHLRFQPPSTISFVFF